MYTFSINIALNGRHWAKMELAQGTFDDEAKYKARLVAQKFAGEDGYTVSLSKWTNPTGRDIDLV